MKELRPKLLSNKETNTLAWVVTNEECNCSNFQNMQVCHYKLPIVFVGMQYFNPQFVFTIKLTKLIVTNL